MNKQADVLKVDGLPIVSANFCWSVGVLMEKFLKALGSKKFMAIKCPKCGYICVPPRSRCVRCNTKMGEKDLIELSGKGTLVSYTVAHVELDGKANFKDLEKPKLIGAIKPDDADSTIFMPLGEVEPKDLKTGMKVSLQWNKDTKGELTDIKYFKP